MRHGHGVSLLTGWLPLTVQVLAVVVLLAAIGRRPRRWLVRCLPALAVAGVAATFAVRAYVADNGLADDPAPPGLWVWTGVTAAALLLVPLGWRSARWSRRGLSLVAVPLALLCAGLVLNDWVGYFPTVGEAWNQVAAGPLPDEVDADQLPALAGTGAGMTTGKVVPVDIPATSSHFTHRTEYVYLPPAWFTPQRPRLPVVLMISGEFNTPADWIRVGDAVQTADAYAGQHQGNGPILAFVDTGGTFNNDTECVNGPRGNVADYLTKDVPGFLSSTFHTATGPSKWGLVGWSAGGSCAVDLAVMHPELFGSFEDIAGDLGPNTGDQASTIAKLYGGDAGAWAAFDPQTVLATHAPYADTAGWFVLSSDTGGPGGHGRPGRRGGPGGHGGWGRQGAHGPHPGGPGSLGGPGGRGRDDTVAAGFGGRADGRDAPGTEAEAAQTLCAAATAKNIVCSLHTLDGRHSWQFASSAFQQGLPWLAGRLGVQTGSPVATTDLK